MVVVFRMTGTLRALADRLLTPDLTLLVSSCWR
jgi:hypothetical protein